MYSTLIRHLAVACIVSLSPMAQLQAAEKPEPEEICHSKLWGKGGELWSPISRLPDFSYAGYQYGEKPIPSIHVVANITDFGADGSDEEDDTAAIKAAIKHVSQLPLEERGAILLSAGRYIVSEKILVAASGIVIRGAGPEKTEVFFTDPPDIPEIPVGEWSEEWRLQVDQGGEWRNTAAAQQRGFQIGDTELSLNIFRLAGPEQVLQFPILTKPGYPDRGSDFVLMASDHFAAFREAFEVGEAVMLVSHVFNREGPKQDDRVGGNPLSLELTGGAWGSDAASFGVSHRQELRITAMADNRVHFDRTIRIPYGDATREVNLYKCDKEFTECGIEDITLSYSSRPYVSHFLTTGRSALRFMHTVRHAWARNIVVNNPDHGLRIEGRHITVSGITLNADRGTSRNPHYAGTTGHAGLGMTGSYNLCERFRINSMFVHNLSISHSFGCVFSEGSGIDINFDHHRQAPYENLFVDIDIGKGTQPFSSSGRNIEGPQIGAYNTYWNIRSDALVAFPDLNDWSQSPMGSGLINLVGINSDRPSLLGPRRWMETMPPQSLQPQNIYQAQLAKRLKGP